MSDRISINIPFAGFYESLYSGEIDSVAEREAEYFANERQDEDGVPKELRLTEREFADILFDATDYNAAYQQIAKLYVEGFNEVASEELGIELGLVYEEMTSPKYYNFETDRLFANVSMETLQALFDMSASDNHLRLILCIKERHTSYDGFHSHYTNRVSEWLEKPLEDWDHNEVSTLLRSLIPETLRDDEMALYYATFGDDGGYTAHSEAVDWPKFDEAVAELRAEKLAELQAEDPDYAPPPVRCPLTLELPFNGELQ